jgi:hypothetical protein
VTPVGCAAGAGAESACAETPASSPLADPAALAPMTFDAMALALVAVTVAPVVAPE